jgi:hypothetical protein
MATPANKTIFGNIIYFLRIEQIEFWGLAGATRLVALLSSSVVAFAIIFGSRV